MIKKRRRRRGELICHCRVWNQDRGSLSPRGEKRRCTWGVQPCFWLGTWDLVGPSPVIASLRSQGQPRSLFAKEGDSELWGLQEKRRRGREGTRRPEELQPYVTSVPFFTLEILPSLCTLSLQASTALPALPAAGCVRDVALG